jgi:hypothetical protein
MGFYTGRTGKLEFYSGSAYKPVAKIKDWSIEATVNLLTTDVLDSTSSTYLPGIKSAKGSATLLYYRLEGTESTTLSEFTALLNKIQKVGEISTGDRVRLRLSTSSSAADDIEFYAYITSAQVSASAGELLTVPIQFTVDGDFIAGGVIT